MMLIVTKYLIPKGYTGLTVYPFIFLSHAGDKDNAVFINHERIHLRQQIEMLILPFFIWYFFEYLVLMVQYKNRNLAYRNISFEREAYANETNLDYLKTRGLFNAFNYLSFKNS